MKGYPQELSLQQSLTLYGRNLYAHPVFKPHVISKYAYHTFCLFSMSRVPILGFQHKKSLKRSDAEWNFERLDHFNTRE